MAFEFVSVEAALPRPGLRMVVVGGIPSGWSEAAKGFLHIKGLDWAAVRLTYDDPRIKTLSRRRTAPSAVLDDGHPRTGWAEILLMIERLAPEPPLLPTDAADRALVFGLSHELCGEQGLGWARRLQLVHAGLEGAGGFAGRVASYLGRKYGYTPAAGAAATGRVVALLEMLSARLDAQKAAGSPFYVGDGLTAVDVYSAAFMAMFDPLPEALCPMNPATREAFESRDPRVQAALAPSLIAHRDRIYETYLELPIRL